MALLRTIRLSLLALETSTSLLCAQVVERGIPYRANPTPDQHLDIYARATTVRMPVVLFIQGGSLEEGENGATLRCTLLSVPASRAARFCARRWITVLRLPLDGLPCPRMSPRPCVG